MRKRWPAIEPHWRVLFGSGTLSCAFPSRNLAKYYGWMMSQAVPVSAVIKVTPK